MRIIQFTQTNSNITCTCCVQKTISRINLCTTTRFHHISIKRSNIIHFTWNLMPCDHCTWDEFYNTTLKMYQIFDGKTYSNSIINLSVESCATINNVTVQFIRDSEFGSVFGCVDCLCAVWNAMKRELKRKLSHRYYLLSR